MIDSVFIGFFYCITHLSVLALPFQILLPVCVLLGVLAGFRLAQKWYLFAGAMLILAVACEGICRLFQMEAVFPLFFTGVIALCVLAGDLIGTVIYKIWTNVRHS